MILSTLLFLLTLPRPYAHSFSVVTGRVKSVTLLEKSASGKAWFASWVKFSFAGKLSPCEVLHKSWAREFAACLVEEAGNRKEDVKNEQRQAKKKSHTCETDCFCGIIVSGCIRGVFVGVYGGLTFPLGG
jgi:hypothetical protein